MHARGKWFWRILTYPVLSGSPKKKLLAYIQVIEICFNKGPQAPLKNC
jgi:hypothetical protein